MKPSTLYRAASLILVLFAAGHTLGFRTIQPAWKIDALIGSMQSTRFDVQGVVRTYWDFYSGFGLFVSLLLLFAAVVSWQLGSVPRDQLRALPGITWSLAIAAVGIGVLSFRYFFIVPMVFSTVLAICLLWAAWAGSRHAPTA